MEHQATRVAVERLFWGAAGGFFGLVGGLAVGTALVPQSRVLDGQFLDAANRDRIAAHFSPGGDH